MAHKQKEIIGNNLLDIRERELKISQKEMGELLGVSSKMVYNYEAGLSDIPPCKADILNQKFGYSFDYIYARITAEEEKMYKDFKSSNIEHINFIVWEQNKPYIVISEKDVIYCQKRYNIYHSNDTYYTKKSKMLELDKEYLNDNDENNNVVVKILIPNAEYLEGILGEKEIYPYCSNDNKTVFNVKFKNKKRNKIKTELDRTPEISPTKLRLISKILATSDDEL